jgi:hypothetical protein
MGGLRDRALYAENGEVDLAATDLRDELASKIYAAAKAPSQ